VQKKHLGQKQNSGGDKMKVESSSIGFGGLLTLLFIGLKLTGYITWSWWWVLSPTLISLCLGIFIVGFCLIMHFVSEASK